MSDDQFLDDIDEEREPFSLPAPLRDPFGVLRRQTSWIATVLLVCLIAAGVVAWKMPLEYEARATILLTAKSIPDEFVPTTILAGILEQFEAVRGQVFSRAGLAKIITATGIYQQEQSEQTLAALALRLRSELTVDFLTVKSGSRSSQSAIAFEVKMSGREPQLLADVVNMTVAELIDANIEYRSRQARVTSDFMKREFDRADRALRDHQRRLAEFRRKNRGALPEDQTAAFSKLDRLEEQRRSAIMAVNDFQARIERIEARPASIAESELVDSLSIRLQNAKAVYTNDHPTVRSLERQMAALLADESNPNPSSNSVSSEELAALKQGIELEQRRLKQIDEDVAKLEEKLALAPTIAESYDASRREEQILRENYVEYLRKLKNAELALSLESSQQGAQLKRVDSALPPTSPKRSRLLVAGLGVVASFGTALLVGVARELLNPVIIDEQHFESQISVPCIGSIPTIS